MKNSLKNDIMMGLENEKIVIENRIVIIVYLYIL